MYRLNNGPQTLTATGGGQGQTPCIVLETGAWRRLVPNLELVVTRAARLGGGAVSVVLTNDHSVRLLNRRFRGQDKATNVLTFASGEIVLALGVVRREAARAGRRPAHHLAHLVLHGALHLRGHDHHAAGQARRMEMREAKLLRRMGVPNPWKTA